VIDATESPVPRKSCTLQAGLYHAECLADRCHSPCRHSIPGRSVTWFVSRVLWKSGTTFSPQLLRSDLGVYTPLRYRPCWRCTVMARSACVVFFIIASRTAQPLTSCVWRQARYLRVI